MAKNNRIDNYYNLEEPPVEIGATDESASDNTDIAGTGMQNSVIDEDAEPLYELPDEEIENLNPAALDFERERENSPLLSMFNIMFKPVEGWKRFKRRAFSTERVALSCFLPLVTLAALSPFISYFYGAIIDIQETVISSVIMFISFFFGYFTVLLTMDLLLPKDSAEKFRTTLGKNFILIAMSTLALFELLYEALPMIDPILAFLPVWTLYIVCRGVKIMRIKQNVENRTAWTLCFLIVGIPILCRWVFGELFV